MLPVETTRLEAPSRQLLVGADGIVSLPLEPAATVPYRASLGRQAGRLGLELPPPGPSALDAGGITPRIEARFVLGYLGAEKSLLEDYYIVRESHAHAWVEAYLPEHGWTLYDPTPAVSASGVGEGVRALFAQAYDYSPPGVQAVASTRAT